MFKIIPSYLSHGNNASVGTSDGSYRFLEGNVRIFQSGNQGNLYVTPNSGSTKYLRLHHDNSNAYIDYSNNNLYIRQSTGTGTDINRLLLNQNGDGDGMKLNTFNNSYGFHCYHNSDVGDSSNNWSLKVTNDGNHAKRRGIHVQCGEDSGGDSDGNVDAYPITFYDGDGSFMGQISITDGTVNYGAFTGIHYTKVLSDESDLTSIIELESGGIYPKGTIVSNITSTINGSSFQPSTLIVSSSTYQDKRVFGVYLCNTHDEETPHQHQIASLGDGVILVCSQNGNIENGDYITSASGSGGYGCKQNDDLLHNYTVAKSLEDVDWSNEPSNTKLIACTYHCA